MGIGIFDILQDAVKDASLYAEVFDVIHQLNPGLFNVDVVDVASILPLAADLTNI